MNNNAGVSAGDTCDIRDVSSIGDADNTIDDKNTYVKAGFSTYNITSAMRMQMRVQMIQVVKMKKSVTIQTILMKISQAG